MKIFRIAALLIFLAFICVCTGSAIQAAGTGQTSEYIWNGTWSAPDYTVYINQDASGITGEYVPFDLVSLDPGTLEGSVSDDGRTYSGEWIENGSNIYTLSDDKMSFAINGSSDPHGPMTGPAYYTSNATRVGDMVDPENPWSGSWITKKKTYNLTQKGTTLTGTNQPLPGVNDNPGVLEGIVSEDGRTYAGYWTEKGRFTFVMSDTGSFFNATMSKGPDPAAIIELMTFSK